MASSKNHLRRYSEAEIQNLKRLGRILRDARNSCPNRPSQIAFAKWLSQVTGEPWTSSNVQWNEQTGDFPTGKDAPRQANPNYLKAVHRHTDLKNWHSLGYLLSLNDGLYVEFLKEAGVLATYLLENSISDDIQRLTCDIFSAVGKTHYKSQIALADAIMTFLTQLKEKSKTAMSSLSAAIAYEMELEGIDASRFAERADLPFDLIEKILAGESPHLTRSDFQSIAGAFRTRSISAEAIQDLYESNLPRRNGRMKRDRDHLPLADG